MLNIRRDRERGLCGENALLQPFAPEPPNAPHIRPEAPFPFDKT
jgi:hypothetical protein